MCVFLLSASTTLTNDKTSVSVRLKTRNASLCVCVFFLQVKETSSLHLFFGLPMGGVRYSLGYQMFGFREKPKPQRPQRQHELPSAASSRASTTSSVFGNRRRLSENSTTLLGGGSTTGSTLFSRAASLFGGGESDDGTVPMTDAAAAPASRGRVRLSGLGHVGMGGSVALCDPASGLAFAMVTNKVGFRRRLDCSTDPCCHGRYLGRRRGCCCPHRCRSC